METSNQTSSLLKTQGRYRQALCQLLFLVGLALLTAPGWAATDSYTDKLTQARLLPQPLLWVGQTPPSEAESQELWTAFAVGEHKPFDEVAGNLEAFIKVHPNSPWVPSLQSSLGTWYRRNGYSTLALNHWQTAWAATKTMTDLKGRQVADETLVNWLDLLARLGRADIMKTLFDETQGRTLPPPLQSQYSRSRAAYESAQKSPQLANRCGTYALNAVAETLSPTNAFRRLIRTPAPRTGFSLASLEEMAASNHLDLVAAERPAGQDELVVPSVVHEKQDHYVAVVARKGDWYKVVDPAFRMGKWLKAEVINAEASGQFLVPVSQMPSGWRSLSQIESAQIFRQVLP